MSNDLPLSRLFPNIVTLLALCAGLSSIRFALDERFELAVTFTMIAAFIDLLDGRLARYLNATSNFGAQLDSLADFCNFGVVPSILLYLWSTHTFPVKGVGWGFVLFFNMCCLIRLARFNSDLEENENTRLIWQEHFFVGMPSTMGGLLSLIPMMLSFEFENIKILENPKFVGSYMVIIALLMASRIPTFATKKLHIRKEFISVFMAVICLAMAGLIIEPWIILSAFGIAYILSIIPSSMLYLHLKKNTTNVEYNQ